MGNMKIIQQGFPACTGRFEKLMDVLINNYDKFDDCIFISSELECSEVVKYLTQNRNNDDCKCSMIIKTNNDNYIESSVIDYCENMLVHNKNDKILILVHGFKPVSIPNKFNKLNITIYNYFQEERMYNMFCIPLEKIEVVSTLIIRNNDGIKLIKARNSSKQIINMLDVKILTKKEFDTMSLGDLSGKHIIIDYKMDDYITNMKASYIKVNNDKERYEFALTKLRNCYAKYTDCLFISDMEPVYQTMLHFIDDMMYVPTNINMNIGYTYSSNNTIDMINDFMKDKVLNDKVLIILYTKEIVQIPEDVLKYNGNIYNYYKM